MRAVLVLISAALIAGCGTPPPNNESSAGPAAGDSGLNVPEPAAPGNDSAGIAEFRARWLEACIGGARDAAPPGTPVDRHCACAIDRVMAGKSLEQLEEDQTTGAYRSRFSAEMRTCIREIPS